MDNMGIEMALAVEELIPMLIARGILELWALLGLFADGSLACTWLARTVWVMKLDELG